MAHNSYPILIKLHKNFAFCYQIGLYDKYSYNCTYIDYLVPTLRVDLSPPLLNGNSGEDILELLCTAIVIEDVPVSYQFVWIKDDISIDLPNDRIVVCTYVHIITSCILTLWLHLYVVMLHIKLYRLPILIAHHCLLLQAMILMLHWTMVYTAVKWPLPYME